VGINFLDKAVG